MNNSSTIKNKCIILGKEKNMNQELINTLLDKSEEAFLMAIEIYNKPTISYRLEGFAFFICNAWELLL